MPPASIIVSMAVLWLGVVLLGIWLAGLLFPGAGRSGQDSSRTEK